MQCIKCDSFSYNNVPKSNLYSLTFIPSLPLNTLEITDINRLDFLLIQDFHFTFFSSLTHPIIFPDANLSRAKKHCSMDIPCLFPISELPSSLSNFYKVTKENGKLSMAHDLLLLFRHVLFNCWRCDRAG